MASPRVGVSPPPPTPLTPLDTPAMIPSMGEAMPSTPPLSPSPMAWGYTPPQYAWDRPDYCAPPPPVAYLGGLLVVGGIPNPAMNTPFDKAAGGTN